MRPTQTLYRLLEPRDHRVCKMIWTRNKDVLGDPVPFGWPTVVAERNGKILGFMSTYPSEKAIVAGPIAVSKGGSPFVFMRLIEAYETVLRMAGVTTYLFSTPKEHRGWIDILERLGFKSWAEDETDLWFRKTFDENLQQISH